MRHVSKEDKPQHVPRITPVWHQLALFFEETSAQITFIQYFAVLYCRSESAVKQNATFSEVRGMKEVWIPVSFAHLRNLSMYSPTTHPHIHPPTHTLLTQAYTHLNLCLGTVESHALLIHVYTQNKYNQSLYSDCTDCPNDQPPCLQSF